MAGAWWEAMVPCWTPHSGCGSHTFTALLLVCSTAKVRTGRWEQRSAGT